MKPVNNTNVNYDSPDNNIPTTLVTGLTPNQKSLHNNFMISAKTLKKSLVKTIYFLSMIKNQKIHKLLGFGTIIEYAEKSAGFSPKQTRNLLSLANNLHEYHEVERAIEDGAITFSKAQQIVTNTKPEEQQKWIDKATKSTLKELKRQIRPNIIKPLAESHKHHLTLKFTSEQLARWSSCMENLQKSKSMNKEEIIMLALGSLLSGSNNASANHPPYLIVQMHCPACNRAMMPTNRGEAEVSPALIKAGHCDATIEDSNGNRKKSISPRNRRLAFQVARYHCQAPGCNNTQFLEIHHRIPASQGGTSDISNLIVLCWLCHRKIHEADSMARIAKDKAPK